MKKICFVCESRYQLLNCLGLIRYHNEIREQEITVLIKEGIVESVFVLNKIFAKYTKIFNAKEFKNVLEEIENEKFVDKISRFFNSSVYLEKYGLNKFEHSNYDVVYIAVPSRLASAIVFSNKKAEVCYFEDGIGSYYVDYINQCLTKLNRIMYSLFNNNYKRLDMKKIFVNKKVLFDSKKKIDVCENKAIKLSDVDYVNELNKIFNNRELVINSNVKWIYLTQPIYEYEGDSSALFLKEQNIIKETYQYSKYGSIRVHPRDNREWKVKVSQCNDGMWELICARFSDLDKMVLISYSSSALFTPCYIFNKQPYLIFTFRLLNDVEVTKSDYIAICSSINKIRKIYTNPEKIYVPNSLKEYVEIIREIFCELH